MCTERMSALGGLGRVSGGSHGQGQSSQENVRMHLSPGLGKKKGKAMAEMRPGGVKHGKKKKKGPDYVTNPRTSR